MKARADNLVAAYTRLCRNLDVVLRDSARGTGVQAGEGSFGFLHGHFTGALLITGATAMGYPGLLDSDSKIIGGGRMGAMEFVYI